MSKLVVLAATAVLTLGVNSAIAKQSDPPSQSTRHTKDCDNDNDPTRCVPDGGATALLVGLGLGAVALANRKKQ